MKRTDTAYNLIRHFYGRTRARRTKRRYIEHIREGCAILSHAFNATTTVRDAFCLHPLVQSDGDYTVHIESLQEWAEESVERRVALDLAIEYRRFANAYRSVDPLRNPNEIDTSCSPAVRQMLVADKAQNWNDARFYLKPVDPDDYSNRLEPYFQSWGRALDADLHQLVDWADTTFPLSHGLNNPLEINDYYTASLACYTQYKIVVMRSIPADAIDDRWITPGVSVGREVLIQDRQGQYFKSLYIFPRYRGIGLYQRWAESDLNTPVITSSDCRLIPALEAMGIQYHLLDRK
jgi:hypothetical protein